MNTPKIDPEFRDAIPALAEEERRHLEDSLVREGCRDALVVWAETGVLLDGHNRLELCEQHGLAYRVEALRLPDRNAALDWIYTHQLGRRNLTPDLFKLVLGRLYHRQKGAPNRPHGKGGQIDPLPKRGKTRERLAEQHGVSPKTVQRAAELATAFDEVRQENPTASQEEAMQQAKELTRKLPKATKPSQPAGNRAARGPDANAQRIRELAAEGHNGPQIAQAIGVGTQYVRELARERGITLPEHNIGKTRLLDNTKIIRETVHTLDGTAAGLRVTNPNTDEIDPAEAAELAQVLAEALKPISALLKQLREVAR